MNTLLSFNPTKKTGFYIMININGDGLGGELGVDDEIPNEQVRKIIEFIKDFESK